MKISMVKYPLEISWFRPRIPSFSVPLVVRLPGDPKLNVTQHGSPFFGGSAEMGKIHRKSAFLPLILGEISMVS